MHIISKVDFIWRKWKNIRFLTTMLQLKENIKEIWSYFCVFLCRGHKLDCVRVHCDCPICDLLYRFLLKEHFRGNLYRLQTFHGLKNKKMKARHPNYEYFLLTLLVSEVDLFLGFLFWLVLVLFAFFRAHRRVDFYLLVDFRSNQTTDFSNLVVMFE